MSSVISWKKVLVVRPHPGHAVTCGSKLRISSDCRICCATLTSSVRSPEGRGVSETRIVSPIPSIRSGESAAAVATIPFDPIPASVRPRCSGYSVSGASCRYTRIRSRTPETLALSTIRSAPSPVSSASSADRVALSTIQSRNTSPASFGFSRRPFSSIIRVSRRWSSDPQFTPMRTALPFSIAMRTIAWKFSSRRLVPTLPGLIRYFAEQRRRAGKVAQQGVWPL